MYKYRDEKDGSATNRYPVDDETTLWIPMYGDKSIQDIMDAAKRKWPDADFKDITMDSVNHHQYCIYYDLYDGSDYVQYVVLSLEEA